MGTDGTFTSFSSSENMGTENMGEYGENMGTDGTFASFSSKERPRKWGFLKIGVICMLLVAVSAAMNVHKLIWYKSPVKRIQGEIVAIDGKPIRFADVVVFSNPEVWSNDSLNFQQKRAKQRKIAATRADEDGRFYVKKLAKGSYEVEFSRGGFDTLSVIVQVDPVARSEKFCVELGVSDTSAEPSFQPCKP